jgi:serine/threonine protein kinase
MIKKQKMESLLSVHLTDHWIADGSFGSVYMSDASDCVIKTFSSKASMNREWTMWRHVKASTERTGRQCVFLGRCEDGLVFRHAGVNLSQSSFLARGERFADSITQLRQAITDLHMISGIEHRDISPGNIVVDRTKLTLIDLSNASFRYECISRIARSIRTSPMIRTPEEIIGLDAQVPFHRDAWALGCVILWLATGKYITYKRGEVSGGETGESGEPSESESGEEPSESGESGEPSEPSEGECGEDGFEMFRELSCFIHFFGSPESIHTRATWMQHLGWPTLPRSKGDSWVGRIRRGDADAVPEHMLQIPLDQWVWVLPMLKGLLSEFATERTHTLHHHPGWNTHHQLYAANQLYAASQLYATPEVPPLSQVYRLTGNPLPSPKSVLLCKLVFYNESEGLNPIQIVSCTTDHLLDMSKVHQHVVSVVETVGHLLRILVHESKHRTTFTHAASQPSLPQPRLLKLLGLAVLSFSVDLMGSFGAGISDIVRLPRAIVPTSEETMWIHETLAFMWEVMAPRVVSELVYSRRLRPAPSHKA